MILVEFRRSPISFLTALGARFGGNTTNSSFRELSNGISHEWSVTSFSWSTLCTKFEYVKKIMLYASPSDVTQPITSPVAIIIATTYFYLTPNMVRSEEEP